ncbi:MAG: hypothetical protein PWQ96_484 [Clostridia bacterium]|jgi:formiminotetrahydrofolate cyclodeaminase|nr:hypothetical protein [Clostridia bacterium]
MNIRNMTISEYLDRVNSVKPLPSAGATLAVTGAFGVSLLGMRFAKLIKNVSPAEISEMEDNFLELIT